MRLTKISVWQYQILMETWRKRSSHTIDKSVNWHKSVVQTTIIHNMDFPSFTKLNPDSLIWHMAIESNSPFPRLLWS